MLSHLPKRNESGNETVVHSKYPYYTYHPYYPFHPYNPWYWRYKNWRSIYNRKWNGENSTTLMQANESMMLNETMFNLTNMAEGNQSEEFNANESAMMMQWLADIEQF